MTDAVWAEGLVKTFGETRALDGLDLAVPVGSVLGLLGPNGAGKTTAVRVFSTLLRPDAGRAEVLGVDVTKHPQQVRRSIGLTGQFAAIDDYLTGRENLLLFGRLYHLSAAAAARRADELLERFDLIDAAGRIAKTYSGGMRRRLDIAASLIVRPPVLFLDEPTTGLDPRTRNDLWLFVEELVAAGTTVLLTTQYMEEAERLAHRIVVIDTGKVIAQGTAEQLKDRLGGDLLEARVNDHADLDRAATLLAELAQAVPHLDADQQRVSVPTKGGTRFLIAAGRRFEDDEIPLADLGIRRPSLDDVFLSLTGSTTAHARDNGQPDES